MKRAHLHRQVHPRVAVGVDDFRLIVDLNDRVLGRMLSVEGGPWASGRARILATL